MPENEELEDQLKELQAAALDGAVQNKWEFEFIESVVERFEKGISFTERQLEVVQDLYEKYID